MSLCTHGTSLELTGLLHTPPAGNIFFCVVIIGDKTETKATVHLLQLVDRNILFHNYCALPGLGI